MGKRKIPDSWRTGWKAKACTSFVLYLKVFKNHLYYLWHVRVLSIKPCLHTRLPEHNESLPKSFPGMGAFDHLEWTYDGAVEQLFGLGRGEFEQKFSKNSNARGLPGGGGMLKLRFDWYITNLHLGGRLRKLSRAFTKWSPFKRSLSKFSQMVSEKEWS